MATAKQVCTTAKNQLGNGCGRYCSTFGLFADWCVIFVWWCFHVNKMHPFGKTAGVSTEMSRLAGRRVGSPKPGDIRVVPPHQHTGIYVGGYVVAGNSGNRNFRLSTVRKESPGGLYYRPKYEPDIIPIKYNGKTYYYNPETKKLCNDKTGKSPVKATTGNNGKNGSNRGNNSGPSSSSGGKETKWKYKEYYVVKPKDFVDAPNIVRISKEAVLTEKSIRIKTLTNDLNLILKLYPNNNKIKNLLNNLKNVYDYNIKNLQQQYINVINVMKEYLVPYTGGTEDKCFIITGTEDNLRYCYVSQYKNDNRNYYKYISESWLNLFNDLTLKRDALTYLLEAKSSYTTPLLTKEYLENRYNEMSNIYDGELISLKQQLDNYYSENSGEFDINNKIMEINQEIINYQLNIDSASNEIIYNYSDENDLQKNIDNYEKIKENMLNQKNNLLRDYFSNNYSYWNKNVIKNPTNLKFWLEFIAKGLKQYNIKQIGLRSFVTTNSTVKSIYERQVPQIIYYDNKNIQKNKTGYNYLFFSNINNNFKNSIQGVSAKTIIDDLLYNYSYCAEQISLTTIPIYYLEPNTRIFIYNKNTKANGEYIINKISKQLSYNGLMTISCVKAVDKLY